jgi:hypothetical protein
MADKKKRQEAKGKPADAATSQVGLPLPIEWHFPEGLVGSYANQALVQMGLMECNIAFFEIRPPLMFGTPEQIQEQAKKITEVRAECVARIVVPHDLMPTLISILQDTWTKHQAKQAATEQVGDKSGDDTENDNGKNGKNKE